MRGNKYSPGVVQLAMKELSLSQLNPEQIQQAIAKCRRQIAREPQVAEVHANLGDLYLQQQQWHKALQAYEQVVEIQPFSARAHRRLAHIQAQLGDNQQATDHLFKLFKSEPDSFSATQLCQLGQTLVKQNKPVRAIVCYRAAIDCQSDLFEAYDELGTLLTNQGKQEAALEVYRQGIRNNPDNAQYYFTLAQVWAEREHWIWASRNYQRASKLESSAKIYYHWGLALYQLEEYSQAQKHFQQASKLEPSAKIYYHWGLALYQLEEYSQAQKCWQKAIALQENYQEPYYQLGLLWQQQQQWEKASLAYKKLLMLNPQSALAFKGVGWVYHNLQQYDQAIVCYTKAIKHSSEGSAIEAEAFDGYQQTLAASAAIKSIDYYRLAKLFRAKSLFVQAIDNYQQSIRLDPYFRDAYIALQYTPVAPEKLTELIKFYRQIVTDYPDLPLAWGNLGDALTQSDRVHEAIECYRTGSYQQAIQTYPNLAKLDWKEKKEFGPDFIVAGASKSGTSSIYFYLSRHPQILLSHTKEIDFYWQNYQRGIDWYLGHFPTITDQDDFLTGEASPNYLRFPQVAQRIKDTFPQTKIILLLRNPADRSISWHYHKLNTGLTNQDLGSAIAEEMARLSTISAAEITKTGFYNPDNILSSLYLYKIKPWIELLGREQFLILKSEDFYADPLENMSQVFSFLGLPNCPLDNYPKVNAGSYNQIDAQLRETLIDYFAPYNQQLEEYLGMKFDWQ